LVKCNQALHERQAVGHIVTVKANGV